MRKITTPDPADIAKVTAEVVTITPQMAYEWLNEPRYGNRRVRDAKVAAQARDMAAGNWWVTGEAIVFSTDGELMDGQHRLFSVIESNTAVESLVVRGVDKRASSVMGSGSKRTASDQLSMQGYSSATTTAATARLCLLFETGSLTGSRGSGRTVTFSEIYGFLEANSALVETAVQFVSGHKATLLANPSIVSSTFVECMKVDKDAATEFFHRFADGIGLEEGSPILALRNRLLTERSQLRGAVPAQYGLILRAWNAWRDGRTMAHVKAFRDGKPLPIPETIR